MHDAGKVILVREVAKAYRKGGQVVMALDGVSLEADATGMVAIVGPSGSGKSTLLHLIGAMDRPTGGEVIVAGQALSRLSERELTQFRRTTVGFVFQTFNLIPNLTALQNVMLPMEFNQVPRGERRERAVQLLERMELGHRLDHQPAELSGGEMQRVAIARALANNPRIILADEPTGNLDSQTGERIYALLKAIAHERTVVVVTHAEPLARLADRVVHLKDGRVAA
jgi:ABC-type lipoprotein export system ATPase subunit